MLRFLLVAALLSLHASGQQEAAARPRKLVRITADCPVSRDAVAQGLLDAGIACRPAYMACHVQPAYRDLPGRPLPETEKALQEVILLPLYPQMTDGEQDAVIRGVVRAVTGERVVIQTGAYVTGGTVVEHDVFLGPGVITTNDDSMGRHPHDEGLVGAVLRRACRIGGGAVLVPGVEIGEEAYVAAGAVVTRDVPPRAVAMGVPARLVREVGEEDLIERWR